MIHNKLDTILMNYNTIAEATYYLVAFFIIILIVLWVACFIFWKKKTYMFERVIFKGIN